MTTSDEAAREALERQLAEPVSAAIARERSTFAAVMERIGSSDVVLLGAGGLGRRVARGLRASGLTVVAFADNNAGSWGTVVEGVPVLAPAEAARRHGDRAVFVVTIWGAGGSHRFAHSRAQLEALGCRAVSSFPPLLWHAPDGTLPHYCQDLPHRVLEQAGDVRRAAELWADDASRDEYVSQVRFRLLADFDGLAHPVAHTQYFPDDLLDFLRGEVFVDCGAFTGDTLRSYIAEGRSLQRAIALEPDPVNLVALRQTIVALRIEDRVVSHAVGVGREAGHAWLDAGGTAASSVLPGASGGSATPIDIVTLDALLADERPTFIKMDIEGAEPDALAGAVRTVAQHRPVLAVSAYHLQNHLWRIPLQLADMTEDYRFFLRPHNEEGWDLVCYAIPVERLRPGGGSVDR